MDLPDMYKASARKLDKERDIFQKIRNKFNGNARNLIKMDLDYTTKLINKGIITTMQDLETWAYGGWMPGMTKDITTGSTGVINTIYGRPAWDQVNREATLFSLLPKKVWTKSGWRVITDDDDYTTQYTQEGGTIPAGKDPNFLELSMTPASIVERNTRSDIVAALTPLDDGIGMEELARWLSLRHAQLINKSLLSDAALASTDSDKLIPLDRLIGEYAEIAYGKADNSAVIPANQLDVYGQDRDAAAGWTDAQVSGQAFGLGDRPLTISLLDDVIRDIRINGGVYGNNMIMVTHPNTANRIDQLLRSQQRFETQLGITYLKGGSAGAQNLGPEPKDGVEGAFQVRTYKGIPIYEDVDVVQDVSLGRVYLINLNYLFMSVLMPTKFYTWGGPELTSSFNDEMLYRTVGQLKCTNFRKQGKIRDLSA